jgi:hypothetical protein
VELRLGFKDDQPMFWEAAEAYASEMVDHGENEVQLGALGTPVPLVVTTGL